MKFKILINFILFISIQSIVLGQDNTLSIENVLGIVKKFHPIAKQASLQNQMASNELTISKSIFDPNIQFNTQEKSFDNKLYFKYSNAEIKIPSWYGIDLKAGIENNYGEKTDPSITKNTSSYVGISMDPFRGIVLDKRKAVVTQARNFIELTKNEQLLVINELLFDASTAYWNWVNAYYNYKVWTKSVTNNKVRFDVIKKSYLSGDKAPIDTTESLTQLQTFEIAETQAALELQKAKNELSNFFWTENGLPYDLLNSVQPDTQFESANVNKIELDNLEFLLQQAALNHPKIKMADNKLNILDLEKRLKTIELFPSLKMDYNVLNNNAGLQNMVNTFSNTSNYKYGVSLTMPLFQRQARGAIAKTKNKIEEQSWNKKYISLEIENKVKNAYSEFYALKQQVKTNEAILNANKLLFDTENTKFQMGESSLFIMNSRELKLIETEQKHIALKTKLYLSIYKNLWAAGSFNAYGAAPIQ